MKTIVFEIHGRAQAQQRSGEQIRGNHIHHFDQPESAAYRSEVKNAAFVAVRGRWPIIDGPVNLAVKEFRAIPSSWSQKKKEAAILGHIRPISRPDLKNLIWIVEDCLNGLMWKDDSRIVSFDGSGKFYSHFQPFLRVEVTAIEREEKPNE